MLHTLTPLSPSRALAKFSFVSLFLLLRAAPAAAVAAAAAALPEKLHTQISCSRELAAHRHGFYILSVESH